MYDSYLISDLTTELIQFPTPGCVYICMYVCMYVCTVAEKVTHQGGRFVSRKAAAYWLKGGRLSADARWTPTS